MAKRKRLDILDGPISSDLETKSALARSRMPIAEVAGDIAGHSALVEVAQEMTLAEDEGRIVKKIPLGKIVKDHLSRDRLAIDEDEMEALQASIKTRGQQTPIEVVMLSDGLFGLISGLRRLEALRRLGASDALALVKRPESSGAAYQAMVEENEIRASLSFYERANIVVAAVEQGVFSDPHAAVKTLFAHAPKAKRSKILKFVTLRKMLGAVLRFPTAIPEHLGLALEQAIRADKKLTTRISTALKKAAVSDAATERRVLEAALKRPAKVAPREEIAPGLTLSRHKGKAVLSGAVVTDDFMDALKAWAARQTP